jgi:Concanavalin A-like lectin/glucanases superfamily
MTMCRLPIFLLCFLISGFWIPSSALAACFNPPGNAGDTRYNGGYGAMQYCNSGSWVRMGGAGDTATGLVGWWKLDESSGGGVDSSGSGNISYINGTPSWNPTGGIQNGALDITPTMTSMHILPSSSLNNLKALTIAVWLYRPHGTDSTQFLANKWGGGQYIGWDFGFDGGDGASPVTHDNVMFWLDGSEAYWYFSIPHIAQWIHVAVTWDGRADSPVLYLDGISLGTDQSGLWYGNTHYDDSANDIDVGDPSPTGDAGLMDDLRIYNRALSAADVMTLFTSTGGASGDINSNLVGWWKLDDASSGNALTTAADSSGSGYTATLKTSGSTCTGGTNCPAWTSSGKIANALTFNGSTQEADVASISGITNTFTVAFWEKTSVTSGQVLWQMGSSASCKSDYSGSHIGCTVQGNTAPTVGNSATDDGNWHHIAYVVNNTSQTLYVDGASRATGSETPTGLPNTSCFGSGNCWGTSSYFNGTLDDVRIYSRALSASDVLTLYDSTKTACASPVGYAGDQMYNAGTNHVMQFCNGTSWIPMGKVPGSGGGGCSSPAGVEGDTIYNNVSRVTQYCDGTTWRAMGGNIPITGLIHWWNFDEAPGATTAFDSIGGANATLTPSAALTTSGKVNNALGLPNDVTSKTVTVTTPSDMIGVSTLTMSMWFKRAVSGALVQVGQQNSSNFFDELGIEAQSSGNFQFDVGTPSANMQGVVANNDTNWHMATMVFDGTQTGDANRLKGFIDGVQQALTIGGPIPATTTTNAKTLYFGNFFSGGATDAGTIDDVRVYNRALSAGEVWRLYNGSP